MILDCAKDARRAAPTLDLAYGRTGRTNRHSLCHRVFVYNRQALYPLGKGVPQCKANTSPKVPGSSPSRVFSPFLRMSANISRVSGKYVGEGEYRVGWVRRGRLVRATSNLLTKG